MGNCFSCRQASHDEPSRASEDELSQASEDGPLQLPDAPEDDLPQCYTTSCLAPDDDLLRYYPMSSPCYTMSCSAPDDEPLHPPSSSLPAPDHELSLASDAECLFLYDGADESDDEPTTAPLQSAFRALLQSRFHESDDEPTTNIVPCSDQDGSRDTSFLDEYESIVPSSDQDGSRDTSFLDEYEVTHQTNTSLTLKCPVLCRLTGAFQEAQKVKPGLKELALIGTHIKVTSLTASKYESLEILRIKVKGGGICPLLYPLADACPTLIELELDFRGAYHILMVHTPLSICKSLRVLKFTGGCLTSKDFISLMHMVAVVYPNIRQMSVSADRYQWDEQRLAGSVSLQLHHLEVLEFSSQGMDQKAEHQLQHTVHAYCPHLSNTKIKDGVYFFRHIQGASGYVDELGGEISIPAHNVTLSIPPGALEGNEKISIEVFSELPTGICLQDNEVVASLGFRCFPSGLTFKKPLILSMPHCAVIADHQEMQMVLHFGNENIDEIVRIPLEINEYVIHNDRIELHLRHFSWGIPTMIYNWLFPGEKSEMQATKRMLCTPFIPTTLPEDQNCPILHLCVYNQLPGLPKEIIEEETSMNYVKVYPEQELIVKDDSIDMSVICESDGLPSEHSEKREISTKDLMQHSKITVGIKLPQRNSMVNLIIRQERMITMLFWPGVKDKATDMAIAEDILVNLAEDIETGEQMVALGRALGFKAAAINRYTQTNIIEGRVTFKGTRDMLLDWRQTVEPSDQHSKLKEALEEANLKMLSKNYLKETLKLPETKVPLESMSLTDASRGSAEPYTPIDDIGPLVL